LRFAWTVPEQRWGCVQKRSDCLAGKNRLYREKNRNKIRPWIAALTRIGFDFGTYPHKERGAIL
jgi:hypothetical protein